MSDSNWTELYSSQREFNLNEAEVLDLSYSDFLAKRSIREKPCLDELKKSLKDMPDLEKHLQKVFEPHKNAPTPWLKDVIILNSTGGKRYLECKNPHSRDLRIVSLEDPHIYFIDGNCENIISSTGFVHAFFPSFDSTYTAKTIITGKTFQKTGHRKSHKYYGCKTYQDVLKRWNKWRDLGTALHDNIECFINGEQFEISEENKNPFEKFMRIYNDKKFWSWDHLRTEWAIFDEDIRLAGKIDYMGIDPETGYLVMMDWKRVGAISDSCFKRWSGSGPDMGKDACCDLESCKYITYSLQLNTYKWILEKNYNVYVTKMYLLQVHPKVKDPILYKVPNMQSHVIKMAARRKLALSKNPPLSLQEKSSSSYMDCSEFTSEGMMDFCKVSKFK